MPLTIDSSLELHQLSGIAQAAESSSYQSVTKLLRETCIEFIIGYFVWKIKFYRFNTSSQIWIESKTDVN